jgi:hypothetical protein
MVLAFDGLNNAGAPLRALGMALAVLMIPVLLLVGYTLLTFVQHLLERRRRQ